MKQTLIVSNRGQLTLPTALRKRFGIKNGGPIILEERDSELALKPAMVLEVEMYTDVQISEWDKADHLYFSRPDYGTRELLLDTNTQHVIHYRQSECYYDKCYKGFM